MEYSEYQLQVLQHMETIQTAVIVIGVLLVMSVSILVVKAIW